MKKIYLVAAALTIMLGAAAQPNRPQELTVEEAAQLRVDQMSDELPLTQKQEKKLLKFYKKDIQYRRDNFQTGNGPRPDSAGGRPQGMPQGGGRSPQGMGQGMGPGGSQGGFPGGGPGMGPQGGRPQVTGDDIDFEKLDKYNQKQEKKLKKILGDDLYSQWRSSHPMEVPGLPEPQLH